MQPREAAVFERDYYTTPPRACIGVIFIPIFHILYRREEPVMRRKLNPSGRYCLYLRKSRADREHYAQDTDVLARHEHILMELAQEMQISITKIFREVVSGDTIAARPEVQRLLSEVEEGLWDGVLVVEVERLARGDTIDQGIISRSFTYSHTLIITPTKIYDPDDEFDSEYFEFGLFMSRREYKTINRRLNRGREQSAAEGKYTGNKAPYGYERVKLHGEKGFSLSPIPQQADIVRMIFTWYVHECGVSIIVRKLNDMHIPAANGGDWTYSSVQGILENPVYVGMIRRHHRPAVKTVKDGSVSICRPRSSDAQLYPGRHPAIVDQELFDAAQKKRAMNFTHPVPAVYLSRNPLAGLVVCAQCGRKMVRRPYYNGRGDSLICYHTNCPQISSPLYLVEQEIINGLRSIMDDQLNSNVIVYEDAGSLEVKEQLLRDTEKELKNLQDQKIRVYDLLEQGIYSTEVFLERSASVAEKITAAEATTEKLQAEIREERARQENRKQFVPRCEHLLSHYDELDVEEKNACLKELLEKVEYNKTEKNKRGEGGNANFTLHLFPRIFSADKG